MPVKSPVDESARQKRSHAKVRTGCATCKARRIKCDEKKPSCSRCSLSDRECVYSVPKAWLFEPKKEPLQSLTPQGGFPSIVLGNHEERRAFDFFKQNTAAVFAGQHELASRFWHNFIPLTANTDMLIFKLAVAMGAQHEVVMYGSEKAAQLSDRSHGMVITTLARSLNNLRVDVSLLCCSMLMAYANLCENVPATAPVHFSLGLKILREETIPGHRSLTDNVSAMVEPIFGELELATAMFTIPAGKFEIICSEPPKPPNLNKSFYDLYEAKRTLSGIIRWLMYLMITHRDDPIELSRETAEVDKLLFQWRQTVIRYSLSIAAKFPGLFLKARKMLFQFKLFGTCRAAARNPIFVEATRVRLLSVDFSQPHMVSVLGTLKGDARNDWRPLAPKPARDHDQLDIWPQGHPAGHDGSSQIIRITVGSFGSLKTTDGTPPAATTVKPDTSPAATA